VSRWIFLRGLTRESRHWGNFPAIFRQAIPDAEVYTPDLPGNGVRYGEASPARVELMVESFRHQLAELGVAPPFHLLAMSLGAMVAVAWAGRYPAEISGGVLINTSLRPFSPFYRRLRPAAAARLLQCLLLGGTAEAWETTIRQLTTRHPACPETLLADWVACRREHPVAPGNALRQLLAAARYRAPLLRPAVPLLVLGAGCDQLVDVACSRRLADAWQIPYAEHPTAGHDLPLDDGAWVAHLVGEWLATTAGGSA